MTYKERLFTRFDRLEEHIDEGSDVAEIVDAEEYVPPHKMAGFSPYDVILTFEAPPDEIDEEDVEAVLEKNGVPFDRVISVEASDDSRFRGETFAFVSLAEY